METWWPGARQDKMADAGKFLLGPYRGVLHTTEGASYAGARAAYVKGRCAPHFTVSVESGEFQAWQHAPIDKAARALRNAPGGVQTNLIPCVQIEIVWKAERAHEMTDTLLDGLRRLMTWVEAQTGVKPWSPPFVGNEGYGQTSVSRMKPESWLAFDGWCGHQHVPENSHWDPGRIPIDQLLRREPGVADMEIHLNEPPKLIFFTPSNQGYWIVAYDGGVFAFGDAPSEGFTILGGGAVEKIIAGDVCGDPADPSTWAMVLMGEDGGVFNLGKGGPGFKGRVFFP